MIYYSGQLGDGDTIREKTLDLMREVLLNENCRSLCYNFQRVKSF